jgi:hypothetical protein
VKDLNERLALYAVDPNIMADTKKPAIAAGLVHSA